MANYYDKIQNRKYESYAKDKANNKTIYTNLTISKVQYSTDKPYLVYTQIYEVKPNSEGSFGLDKTKYFDNKGDAYKYYNEQKRRAEYFKKEMEAK
jgi:hypothetical protein